jgi:hypothetical protein
MTRFVTKTCLSAHARGWGRGPGRDFRGYPVATFALYGPDEIRATKLTVGIVPAENAEVADLRCWFVR